VTEPRTPLVAASILAANFLHLEAEARRAEAAGADWLHMDIMDGHFVDNISFGPAVVKALAKTTRLPIDVHLMIEQPDRYFNRFAEVAENITVHVEAQHDVAATLEKIREAGCTAGLALNPPTPFDAVIPYLGKIDLLLVMTVNPGFGGQEFITKTVEKVRLALKHRSQNALRFLIEVDGGINEQTSALSRENGAEVLVAGNYLFNSAEMKTAVNSLRR
jgi:ribulose-phosphate 3-epimerase